MADFEACCDLLLGHEGEFTDDPADPGNWTGGKPGAGKLLGTKYGIAANSFPTLDIKSLTLADARGIYRQQYWTPSLCDYMPGPLALLMFDSAVNNGKAQAARFLQRTIGATVDGQLGTASLAALQRYLGNGSPARTEAVCIEFLAQRIFFHAGLSTWPKFGLGWSRRLAALPFQACRLG